MRGVRAKALVLAATVVVFSAASVTHAANVETAIDLVIREVFVDPLEGKITILGANFGANPAATLGDEVLVIESVAETTITALLPVLPAGAYRLVVSSGDLPTQSAAFEVLLGAVGIGGAAGPSGAIGRAGPSGPSGPKGEPGPTGATGAAGGAGPLGRQGVTGSSGPQGRAGWSGAFGTAGAAGRTGATGATGPAPTPPACSSDSTRIDTPFDTLCIHVRIFGPGPTDWQAGSRACGGHLCTHQQLRRACLNGYDSRFNGWLSDRTGDDLALTAKGNHDCNNLAVTRSAFAMVAAALCCLEYEKY